MREFISSRTSRIMSSENLSRISSVRFCFGPRQVNVPFKNCLLSSGFSLLTNELNFSTESL